MVVAWARALEGERSSSVGVMRSGCRWEGAGWGEVMVVCVGTSKAGVRSG